MNTKIDFAGYSLLSADRPVFTEFEGELREGQSPAYVIDVPERAPWSLYMKNKSTNEDAILSIDFQNASSVSQQVEKLQPGSSILVPVVTTATQFVITNPLTDEKVPVTLLVF